MVQNIAIGSINDMPMYTILECHVLQAHLLCISGFSSVLNYYFFDSKQCFFLLNLLFASVLCFKA